MVTAGEWPEPGLLEQIVAAGEAAVEPLLDVLKTRPRGWPEEAPICHAAGLLSVLQPASAPPDLCAVARFYKNDTVDSMGNALAAYGRPGLDALIALIQDPSVSGWQRITLIDYGLRAAGPDPEHRARLAEAVREVFARVVEEARQAEAFEDELLAEPAPEDTSLVELDEEEFEQLAEEDAIESVDATAHVPDELAGDNNKERIRHEEEANNEMSPDEMLEFLALDLAILADLQGRELIVSAAEAGLLTEGEIFPEEVGNLYEAGGEVYHSPAPWLESYKECACRAKGSGSKAGADAPGGVSIRCQLPLVRGSPNRSRAGSGPAGRTLPERGPEDRPQRPLLVRQRQEVQEMPPGKGHAELIGMEEPTMNDPSSDGTTRRRFLGAGLGLGASATAMLRRNACRADEPDSVPATDPKAISGDRIEPRWEEMYKVRVGTREGDLVGDSEKVIQAAVDQVAARGGGTVLIGPGTYRLRNAVYLPSRVRIMGVGPESILMKEPSVSTRLAASSDWYDQEITLADTRGFQVGDGVCLRARNPNTGGPVVIKRTLVARSGNRFKLDKALRENLWLEKGEPTASTLYPCSRPKMSPTFASTNITLDGNRANNENLDGNYAGCIFAQDCSRLDFTEVIARNNNGDGISWQICHDVLVEHCESHDHAGLGLAPRLRLAAADHAAQPGPPNRHRHLLLLGSSVRPGRAQYHRGRTVLGDFPGPSRHRQPRPRQHDLAERQGRHPLPRRDEGIRRPPQPDRAQSDPRQRPRRRRGHRRPGPDRVRLPQG